MANENCLNGIQCPSCKSDGPFTIETSCIGVWVDDGIGGEDCSGFEYDGGSNITCMECDATGIVDQFRRKEKDGEEKEESL
jgi:hypothetical protein